MIKNKNVNIQAFGKQLKLPTTKPPQAKKIGKLENEKESMFKLIVKQNLQIQKMEVDMETLLKEKEHQLCILTAIPIGIPSRVGTTTRTSTTT